MNLPESVEVKESAGQLFFVLPEEKKVTFVLFQRFAVLKDLTYDWEKTLLSLIMKELSPPPDSPDCDLSSAIAESKVKPREYETMFTSIPHAQFLGYCVIIPPIIKRGAIPPSSHISLRRTKQENEALFEDV